MSKNLSFLSFVFLAFTLAAQPQLMLKESKQNFGFVKKGEEVKILYTYTNIGNQPLIITDAKVACSCTTINFPKEPLQAGKSAVIEVLFDTSPAHDRQDRTVELISNDPKSPHKIRFKGVVRE